MEPVGRIFAGELGASTHVARAEGPVTGTYLVSPGGAWCHRIFLAGALTEVRRYGDVTGIRVADSTGTFRLSASPRQQEVLSTVSLLEPPAFVACTGIARMSRSGVSIQPESLHVVDRTIRDAWVIGTAARTLERLERFCDFLDGKSDDRRFAAAAAHYETDRLVLRHLAGLVDAALSTIRGGLPAGEVKPVDPRSVMIDLLAASGEAPRDGLVRDGVCAGLSGVEAERIVDLLLEEGECYEPRPGVLRPL